MLEPLSLST